jgi:polar amino acid transport system permease protein
MNSTIDSPSLAATLPDAARQVLAQIRARSRRFVLSVVLVVAGILALLFGVLSLLGIDLGFMYDWLGFLLAGIGYTLLVAVLAISLACVIALFGALGRLSRNPIAYGIATFYVSLIRGTPLLVQVYMWYLALPQIGQALEAAGVPYAASVLTLPAVPAGILALGVCYGAYMTETFRAGIQSIIVGQTEAALALGMTHTQVMRRIILPQALRVVIPPIGNEFISMVKDSSLVSLMGVWELSYRATKIGRRYFRSLEMLLVAAAVYWVMCILLQAAQGRLELRMSRGERKRGET